MSSLVIFDRNGVIAEWNKDAAFSVRVPTETHTRRWYATKAKAIAAAKRMADRRAPAARPAIQDVIKLARAFGEQVQAAFTTAEFREICARNKSGGAYDEGCCATHDFADANMLMHAAFIDTFDRDPLDGPDGGVNDADTALWNDAWAVAKAAEFFA